MYYMNIEKTIMNINLRPKMFIEKMRIDNLYFLLTGYLLCAQGTEINEEIDTIFRREFNNWSINWILINLDRDFSTEVGPWYYLFQKSAKTEEEAVENFFQASKEFFDEYHKDNSKT
ncbi:hypothetical protein LI951_09880 [Enterococcus sp. BWT-B8]|uniref:hypothetical protein n=1 Tax=Enterococcus sp. BWT-B8 TaxID=2885157 RepID=UPI001E62BC72|nr:hypothetical protein [Enterococcus sp. BWT-B8]MCB5952373.1 hypothetical protein [Enterococcus sp. BWT-B8]